MSHKNEELNEWNIESYLDKPTFITNSKAAAMLLAIEIDSDRYLTTPARVAVYCNLRDTVELLSQKRGGANLN